MGKISNMALGIMVAFFLVGLLNNAIYDSAPDSVTIDGLQYNKSTLVRYDVYKNKSLLGETNLSYEDTKDSVSNLVLLSETLGNDLTEAQTNLDSQNLDDKLAGAFGIISTVTIGLLKLLIAIVLEASNFFFGLSSNIQSFPQEWRYLSGIFSLIGSLVFVYLILKLISAQMKWDL
jgi:hypothetical protein